MVRRTGPPSSSASTTTTVALIALIIVLIVARFGIVKLGGIVEKRVEKELKEEKKSPAEPPPPKVPEPSMEMLIGEVILQGYAAPETSAREDIIRMAHALSNFALLIKGENPLPLGSNEEIAAALRGKNRANLRFLADTHPAFNAQGQIVDRWGTPLFFHAESRERLDIRSAGPDKAMWTEDDVHRKHDGQFLRGEDLKSPSLLGTGNSRKQP
jgi:hypothetical protein